MQDTVSSRRILYAVIAALAVFSAVTGAIVALFYGKDEPFRPDPTESEQMDLHEENGVRYLGSSFTVSEFTDTVTKGDTASVTVSAASDTKVSIDVYYASGKSSSSVFTAKTASDTSYAVWEWRVPSDISTSVIRVVLRSADTYATFNITLI